MVSLNTINPLDSCNKGLAISFYVQGEKNTAHAITAAQSLCYD